MLVFTICSLLYHKAIKARRPHHCDRTRNAIDMGQGIRLTYINEVASSGKRKKGLDLQYRQEG